MSSKTLKLVLLLTGAGAVLFIVVITILGLDFVRWVNCNSPFTPEQDKNSEVCRRLRSAP
ncbi:MAG TPA: hypothetical protein V6C64_00065 [Microcoleaceae cyanobacterium]|jgi:hypothetical protein